MLALLVLLLALAALWNLAHTRPLPRVAYAAPIEKNSLQTRVEYLADPALRGRFPLTWGSRQARGLIKREFAACGLVPWGDEPGYDRPFTFGTNVIGVLPGSDPQLKDEYILVSAHYDHIGGRRRGASDNAAGVAALLELAERFSKPEARPRRSLCFAAFDEEENGLLGAFAFTCRKDVDLSRFAGVVNMDTLGRRFMDGDVDGLIVSGTEGYPAIRDRLSTAAKVRGLRPWHLGSELIGPRGDHFAFEDREFPVLFLTNGTFAEYHGRGDTADNLDYGLLTRSAGVAAEAVEYLANEETIPPRQSSAEGDRQELESVREMFDVVLAQPRPAKVDADAWAKLGTLRGRLDDLAACGSFTHADKEAFIMEGARLVGPNLLQSILAPAVGKSDVEIDDPDHMDLAAGIMYDSYSRHRGVYVRGCRALISDALDRGLLRLAFLGLPRRQHLFFGAHDDEVILQPLDDGQCRLSALILSAGFLTDIRSFGRIGDIFPQIGYDSIDFRGTSEECLDYCLMHAIGGFGSSYGDAPQGKVEGYGESWGRILTRIAGESHGDTGKEWIAWRAAQLEVEGRPGLCAKLAESDNPRVAEAALRAMVNDPTARPKNAPEVAKAILASPRHTACARAWALHLCDEKPDVETLLAMAALVADESRFEWWTSLTFLKDETYPLYDHPYAQYSRQDSPELDENIKGRIGLGKTVQRRLKGLTGQDFGADVAAWQEWIRNRPQEEPR